MSTDFWLFTEDRAEQQVENRWTTCCRMGEECADLISDALAQEVPQHAASAIAQTDDGTTPDLWGVLLVSALGLGVLAVLHRKQTRE